MELRARVYQAQVLEIPFHGNAMTREETTNALAAVVFYSSNAMTVNELHEALDEAIQIIDKEKHEWPTTCTSSFK